MTRQCGSCTLCCRLLPVKEISKPSGIPCLHQGAACCKIYAKRPTSCRMWSCLWLESDEVGERPDRAHYVVDMVPDRVWFDGQEVPAIQVWVDPAYRDAHNDPVLRAFLDRQGDENGYVAIIRYNYRDGFVLVPPSLGHGKWFELSGTVVDADTHKELSS
jgi:hypothetical protein